MVFEILLVLGGVVLMVGMLMVVVVVVVTLVNRPMDSYLVRWYVRMKAGDPEELIPRVMRVLSFPEVASLSMLAACH
jgi:hypothetical protein